MSICLGNLSIKDVVHNKCTQKVLDFLNDNGYQLEPNCDSVSKKEGNYHIYDIPKVMHICGQEKGKKFLEFVDEEEIVTKDSVPILSIKWLPKS